MDRVISWPRRADITVAAVITVLTVGGCALVDANHAWHGDQHVRSLDAGGYLLAVVAGAVLAWRRQHPAITVLAAFAAVTAYNRLDYPGGPAYLPLIVATVSAIYLGARRSAYAVLAAGYLLAARPVLGSTDAATQLAVAAWLLVLAAGTELVRYRARAARAEARTAREAALIRQEQERRRAGEQRLRIAQDLHDVLAHQLALITVQANAGLALLTRRPSDPERVAAALRTIKDSGNVALGELRCALDLLRAGGEDQPRRPTPLLSRPADLEQLVASTCAAGLRVRQEITGPVRSLPVPVDTAGYRIVQEALTNAVRHAGPGTTVALHVAYDAGALRVHITDDGRGAPALTPAVNGGNGLPGMGERVTTIGGTLRAEPLPTGGFAVDATLPTGAVPLPAGAVPLPTGEVP